MVRKLFTSESVTEGHPDKICDQISDAVLDAILAQDPNARVACETMVTTGLVVVTGEITTTCYVDIPKIVRKTIKDIGYTRAKYGFDGDTCGVITSIDEQSSDIALGVDKALESKEGRMSDEEIEAIGAGDQGMMFGYATNETPELMPLPISLAHKLSFRLAQVRKQGILGYLRPDGKTQVTVEYEGDRPVRVDTIVISTQHSPEVDRKTIEADIIRHVIRVVPQELLDGNTVTLSILQVDLLSEDPKGIQVSPDERSLWTPMGDMGDMGAAPSQGRILPRWIGRHPMRLDMWQRILLRRGWRTNVRFSLPMPSVWHSRYPFLWKPLERQRFLRKGSIVSASTLT